MAELLETSSPSEVLQTVAVAVAVLLEPELICCFFASTRNPCGIYCCCNVLISWETSKEGEMPTSDSTDPLPAEKYLGSPVEDLQRDNNSLE